MNRFNEVIQIAFIIKRFVIAFTFECLSSWTDLILIQTSLLIQFCIVVIYFALKLFSQLDLLASVLDAIHYGKCVVASADCDCYDCHQHLLFSIKLSLGGTSSQTTVWKFGRRITNIHPAFKDIKKWTMIV